MKLIIGLIVAGVLFYFRFGPGKRFLTEKPSNTVPKNASYTGQLQKIVKEDYQRFILTKGSNTKYLMGMTKEYGELSGGDDFVEHTFKISTIGDWSIILVEETVSFYVYHNLVGWFTGYDNNPDIPDISVGYAKHISDNQKDYFFYLDSNNMTGDTEIGAFRNGNSFFIYLPEAYEEYGNLKMSNKVIAKAEDTIDLLNNNDLDIKTFSRLEYVDHNIKFYK